MKKKKKKVTSSAKNKDKHVSNATKKKSTKKHSKKNSKKKINRAEDGKWLKGVCYNPKGRPKGDSQKDKLLLAISQAEREKQKSLYKHYVDQGYKDNIILKDIVSKFVPSTKHVDLTTNDNIMSDEEAQEIQNELSKRVPIEQNKSC